MQMATQTRTSTATVRLVFNVEPYRASSRVGVAITSLERAMGLRIATARHVGRATRALAVPAGR